MRNVNGWQPISEYSREKYDWVLVKYYDNGYECVPAVAEMRKDGQWYDRMGFTIPFDICYFFDMQQLDKGEENEQMETIQSEPAGEQCR